MRSRFHVFVDGDVQGVGFRYFVRRVARSLGLAGWVRNLPDGRVEAVFEGEQDKAEKMLTYCREGPPMATVSKVEVLREEPRSEELDFRIVV